MRAIVHIGAAKTGTTSIQELLFLNRGALRARGVHFVQSPGQRNNRLLAAYCEDDNVHDPFVRRQGITRLEELRALKENVARDFTEELEGLPPGIDTVVISSEHFHSRVKDPRSIGRLKALLAPWFSEVRILCYVREQAAACVSVHSTAVRAGNLWGFDLFLESCRPEAIHYNYDAMLANWERVFGRDAMVVRVFERAALDDGDLLHDFVHRLDPSLVPHLDMAIPRQNESLTAEGLAVGQLINVAFPRPEGGRGEATEAARQRCHAIAYAGLRGTHSPLTHAQRLEIEALFRPSNEAVRARYFPERPSLFAPVEAETVRGPQGPSDCAEAVEDILAEIRRSDAGLGRLAERVELLLEAADVLEPADPRASRALLALASELRPGDPAVAARLAERDPGS